MAGVCVDAMNVELLASAQLNRTHDIAQGITASSGATIKPWGEWNRASAYVDEQ